MADDRERTTKVEEGDLNIHSMEIPPETGTTTPTTTANPGQEKPSNNG